MTSLKSLQHVILNVDILVTGHSHECKVEIRKDGRSTKFEEDQKVHNTENVGFYINPGSASGAASSYTGESHQPSFVLLDINQNNCITYIYKLKSDDEVSVEKVEYIKQIDVIG